MVNYSKLGLAFLLVACSLTAMADAPLIIVALGDSTTAGTPFFLSPLESPPSGQGDPEGQYAYWMMKKHPDWKVINCGINGQTTDQIQARLDQAFSYHPRYLIILGGVNDIYQGLSLNATARNLNTMYHEAKLNGVIPIAATVLPFSRATAEQSKAINKLNAWIIKNADEIRIEVADLHAAVCDPQDCDKLNGTPDGLHPDVGGYRTMGLVLAKIIDKMEATMPREISR